MLQKPSVFMTVLLVCGIVFLAGCSGQSVVEAPLQPAEADEDPIEEEIVIEVLAEPDDSVPISPVKADKLVREFVRALNNEDAAKVLSCMTTPDNEYYTVEWAEAALANYQVYFNGEKIKRAELFGSAQYHQGLIYRLYTTADNYKEIYVNAGYVDGEYLYDDLFVYDNILFYSYRAANYLNGFIRALQQNEPQRIVSLLTYDHPYAYPEEKALEVIANYATHFDLQTIEWKFAGTETKKAGEGNLIYVIYGTKNNTPVEHEITVVYGDGLVGINDQWIPSKDD